MRPGTKLSEEAISILRDDGILELLKRTGVFFIKEALLIYYRFVDWAEGRRSGSPFTLSYTAKYKVNHSIREIPAFDFWYRFDSPHVRHRIMGEYETEVVEKLVACWDEQTKFWEVGAGWGYHSLSAAHIVDQVVAFDPDTKRTDLLRRSCEENEFENISIVTDQVDSLDNYTDTFEYPDIILMDIDGWEYDVIPNSPGILEYGCTWIIELHHDVDVPPAQNSTPEQIENLFKEHGYTVERVREHYQMKNWRGERTDEINTHHILAHSDE
jgi:hypothetical protein